mmetsp:Transcript_19560/g.48000  ORF Transcript_19560/g.48000 Transcript_19560/m.48000 type:complete len:468 (+) Transcript_19560:29-1432(+)|eukprot:CAMPEP_0206231210 /NCGR_PEP_ID=MMETSP0047_2-20121206/10708_1 /ASSEMBLY_ACC=CAM_ASM_000192 /TAXON_ID=195065 /ORGANISM="Chroomonas mesostigmatica_cf, Strain CCMP1168" /LENGTH=467 /DNA_ID=CAMNT_0053654759 /DNA_START=21 /DNA_END=1424 /DNA_ORIENTATION=+
MAPGGRGALAIVAVVLVQSIAFAGAFAPGAAFKAPVGPFLRRAGSPARPGRQLAARPLTGGSRGLRAVVEGADAAQHLAFLATHVDMNALNSVDLSGIPEHLHSAVLHLADAAAATVDAAQEVAKEEEKPGVFGSLVLGVRLALEAIHTLYKSLGVPGAWGLAICTFTIAVKSATYPLNYKQMASTMAMQKLSPKLKAIQSRYKDDPQRMNEMTAQLYKDEEVNPLAGCIPTLIQLPIFIALYRGLLELAQADKLQESFLWIPSLEGPVGQYNPVTGLPVDSLGWLTKNWVDGHPAMGWADTLAYLSLPIILVVTQSISQKLLQPPQSDDPAQQQTQAILKFLPLMIGWFALNVPAGLGVYWVINNGLSTLQQWYIRQQFKDPEPATAGADGSAPSSMSFQDELRSSATKMPEAPKFKVTPKANKEKAAAEVSETSEDSEDDGDDDGEVSKAQAKKQKKAKGKKKRG